MLRYLDDASQVIFIFLRFLSRVLLLVGTTLGVVFIFYFYRSRRLILPWRFLFIKHVDVQIHFTVGVSCMIILKDDDILLFIRRHLNTCVH